MTEDNTAKTVKKQRGRPFQRGFDARRNLIRKIENINKGYIER